MRSVEVGGAQLRLGLGVEADRAHEAERLGDAVGDFLIALRLRAVLDEAQHPTMGVLQIGVAAGGERAQQIKRRRRLAIGLQLPARIGRARLGGEFDVVDDVAAVDGQGDAADRLAVRRARLRELPGDAPDLDDRRGRRVGHHHRHLEEDAEEVADVVGRMFAEALGAIAALQQERFADHRLAERALELARFAGEHQRRIAGELALDLLERRRVGIDRRLLDRLSPPALGTPAALGHNHLPRLTILLVRERRRAPARARRLYRNAPAMAICRFSAPEREN